MNRAAESLFDCTASQVLGHCASEALVPRAHRDALHQAQKLSAMGGLLAGVAHELNNPLAIVIGRATLLEERVRSRATLQTETLQTEARQVREAAERCGRIVRTFLDLARKKPADRRAVQLNTLVNASTELLAYSLCSHGVTIKLELDEHLPEIQADGDQLGQVLLNLLVNAQQALESRTDGERKIRVCTSREEGPHKTERVCLKVTDTGPGVPTELRERVFEPYFTTKTNGRGTGLGLSSSRAIAREHGGELRLASQTVGCGASFVLELPVGQLGGRQDAATAAAAATGTASARSGRILVVDDEVALAQMVGEMLESAGYEVSTARTGQEALAILAADAIDAVVSDLHMPGMDGAALWARLSSQQPALARRILFMTGDALSSVSAAFLARSGCSTLSKPFRKSELMAQVDRLLQG